MNLIEDKVWLALNSLTRIRLSKQNTINLGVIASINKWDVMNLNICFCMGKDIVIWIKL